MRATGSGVHAERADPQTELAAAIRATNLFGDAFFAAHGSIPARYLAGARAIIAEALKLEREERIEAGGCAPPVIANGGPRFTETR